MSGEEIRLFRSRGTQEEGSLLGFRMSFMISEANSSLLDNTPSPSASRPAKTTQPPSKYHTTYSGQSQRQQGQGKDKIRDAGLRSRLQFPPQNRQIKNLDHNARNNLDQERQAVNVGSCEILLLLRSGNY